MRLIDETTVDVSNVDFGRSFENLQLDGDFVDDIFLLLLDLQSICSSSLNTIGWYFEVRSSIRGSSLLRLPREEAVLSDSFVLVETILLSDPRVLKSSSDWTCSIDGGAREGTLELEELI